jgi:hypothetical protein
MTRWWLTVYNNTSITPVVESFECDSDPSVWLGEPMWSAGDAVGYDAGNGRRLLLTSESLTDSMTV